MARSSRVAAPHIALCGWLTLAACAGDPDVGPVTAVPGESDSASEPAFVDRAGELGLDFTHVNGMTGSLLYAEMMGAGVAVLDYDGDGDLDVYLVQGGRLEPRTASGGGQPSDRLYRNDLGPAGSWRFVDVSARAGALASGYGMGVAVGDVDADGNPDLYVTQLGPNVLLLNRGDGSFTDRTVESGTGDPGWSVPAVFFDADADGRDDLYVGNYLEYSVAVDRACFGATGARDYCGPTAYPGASDRLYRNLGGGRFEDVSAASGIGRRGRTLGALALEIDRRPALYVANDGEPNYLWVSRGGGRFVEGALAAGAAVDLEGRPQASMGVDAGDYDRDGDDDLVVTHLAGEATTLYRADDGPRFVDGSRRAGIAAATLSTTGFGVGWIDVDGDGWLDLVSVNGAVKRRPEQVAAGAAHPLAEAKQLLRNRGDGSFEDLSASAGEAFSIGRVGRGLALGDLDGDGDLDLVATNNNGPAELLIDPSTVGSGWVGAVVEPGDRVSLAGAELPVTARSRRDGSYASARDPRVILTANSGARLADIEVRGSNRPTRYLGVPTGRYLIIRR